MRIGIDFDNTTACYEGVCHAAALERGLIAAGIGRDKNSVRDHLNGAGRNDDFTELQGYVYGARMDLVAPYPGFAGVVAPARNDDLTNRLGYFNGARLGWVATYPGFAGFVAAARKAGQELFIVSHKTRHP